MNSKLRKIVVYLGLILAGSPLGSSNEANALFPTLSILRMLRTVNRVEHAGAAVAEVTFGSVTTGVRVTRTVEEIESLRRMGFWIRGANGQYITSQMLQAMALGGSAAIVCFTTVCDNPNPVGSPNGPRARPGSVPIVGGGNME